ncbi:MAG: tyrosine-protein phosphatase [Rhizorhabdus sp.]
MTGTDATDRVIACKGIHNFRDYGNYRTAHGRLRTGRFFRSAQHLDADADDLQRVAGLGLAVVVDLRGGSERRAAPCPRPAGFDAEVIAIDDETVSRAPHVEAARTGMTQEQAHESMARAYRTMPFRPVLMQLYAQYFRTLSETDRPTLIHCLAGKDRTGIAVALFHHITGVHRDDMIADYLLTNVAGNVDGRVRAGGQHIKVHYGDMSDDALRILMSVDALYLDNAFAAMTEEFGGIDGYLEKGLGITPEQRERIVAHATA